MITTDPTLPAVTSLTGAEAGEVLRPAIEAAGGQLYSSRVSHVHYVPGRELVVRYRCDIEWPDKRRTGDTILAATTTAGILPGTIPVVADSEDGPVEVSVWRWPFDPVVAGAATAVTSGALQQLLEAAPGVTVEGKVSLDVLAYRPTDRIVSRATDAAGHIWYVKARRPGTIASLAARHEALRSAGVPAAPVAMADDESGLLVLDELPGATLRERLKAGQRPWPTPTSLWELCSRVSEVEVAGPPTRATRTEDAIAHAEMLTKVLPGHSGVLDELVDRFGAVLPAVRDRRGVVIHSDLHEAQLIVDDRGGITGLLDVDDLAPGDPLDDPATIIGHLRYRSIALDDQRLASQIRAYADEIRAHARRFVDPEALDVTIAAVLVGLATGPFRIQLPNWQSTSADVLADAARLIGGAEPAEGSLAGCGAPT